MVVKNYSTTTATNFEILRWNTDILRLWTYPCSIVQIIFSQSNNYTVLLLWREEWKNSKEFDILFNISEIHANMCNKNGQPVNFATAVAHFRSLAIKVSKKNWWQIRGANSIKHLPDTECKIRAMSTFIIANIVHNTVICHSALLG